MGGTPAFSAAPRLRVNPPASILRYSYSNPTNLLEPGDLK